MTPPPLCCLRVNDGTQPDDTMTIIGMYDTVPLIHEAKKLGATLMEFLRGVRQDGVFASRSNVMLLGSELSDLGLTNGEKERPAQCPRGAPIWGGRCVCVFVRGQTLANIGRLHITSCF